MGIVYRDDGLSVRTDSETARIRIESAQCDFIWRSVRLSINWSLDDNLFDIGALRLSLWLVSELNPSRGHRLAQTELAGGDGDFSTGYMDPEGYIPNGWYWPVVVISELHSTDPFAHASEWIKVAEAPCAWFEGYRLGVAADRLYWTNDDAEWSSWFSTAKEEAEGRAREEEEERQRKANSIVVKDGLAAQSYKPASIGCEGVRLRMADGKVTISADKIKNRSTWSAGALNLTLWYCEKPYQKGDGDTNRKYEMADGIVSPNALSGESGKDFFDHPKVVGDIKADPPTGDYYALVVIYEKQSDGKWNWRNEYTWSKTHHWDNQAEARKRAVEAERKRILYNREKTTYGLPPGDVRQRLFDSIAEAKTLKNAKKVRPKTQAYVERLDTLLSNTHAKASVLPWEEIASEGKDGGAENSYGCVLPEYVSVGQLLREAMKGKPPFPASMDGHFPSETFPCLMPFREASGICFEGEPEKMEKQAQLCILRILLSLHPSYVKFTLVDMVTMGRAMGVLSPLRNDMGFKILSTDEDLESFLEQLQREVTDKNTTVLSKYEWLWQYNKANPAVAESYRIVMLSSGREGVGPKSAQLLKQLVARGNAAHAGIYFLFCDTAGDEHVSSRSDLDEAVVAQINADWQRCRQEMGHVVVGSLKNEAFKEGWVDTRDDSVFPGFCLECPEPPPEILGTSRQRIVSTGKTQTKEVVQIPIPESEWWTKTSGGGLTVPIGMQSGAEIQYFSLGNGSNAYHALVGGNSGFGKTVLLHEIILNAAQLYSPAELRVHLLDYKGGTEFSCYKALPHLDTLSVGPNVEFGLDILKDLSAELDRRSEQFKSVGVGNISEFRKKTGEEMPRHLVVIDEFDVLLADPVYGETASLTLEALVRRGRSYGLNLILSTQNLRGANLNAAAKAQFELRICLKLEQSACEDFLTPGNMIASNFTKKGEAVYNERGGLPDGNRLFRSAYLNKDEINSIVGQLREKAIEKMIQPREPSIYDGDKLVPFPDLRKSVGPDVLCIGQTKGLRSVVARLPITGDGFRALAIVGGSTAKREAFFSALSQQLSEMGVTWRALQDGSLKDETERWRRWDMGEEPACDCPSVYIVRNLNLLKDARDPNVQSALGGVIGATPDGASSLLVLEDSNYTNLVGSLDGQNKPVFAGILVLDEDGVYEVSSKNIPLRPTEGWWIGPSMEEGRKVALATGHP